MNGGSRRYVALLVASDVDLTREKLSDEVESSVRRIFGEQGVLWAAPRLIDYDTKRMIGIVRCSHLWVERLRAAVALRTEIDGSRVAFFTLRSAGTLAALRKFLHRQPQFQEWGSLK